MPDPKAPIAIKRLVTSTTQQLSVLAWRLRVMSTATVLTMSFTFNRASTLRRARTWQLRRARDGLAWAKTGFVVGEIFVDPKHQWFGHAALCKVSTSERRY